jgi:hypothetical protein
MTHITETRVTGNQADMGRPAPTGARIPLTVKDVLRAGARRRAGRREIAAAQSTWEYEGGATGEGESSPTDRDGRAPRGLGR